jgi:hypothetical protein
MSVMSASVGKIRASVAQYEEVVSEYQASIDQVQAQLNHLSIRLPQITRTLAIGLTIFLLWMAVAQLGLLTQGWELVTESVRREVVEDITDEQIVIIKEEGD